MQITKTITLHAQEIRNEKNKFIACSAEINKKWYKIKFTQSCNIVPKEKGLYTLVVDVDEISLEKGKPYTNSQGKKVNTNDIIWVRNVVELTKYSEEDLAKANRLSINAVFGD